MRVLVVCALALWLGAPAVASTGDGQGGFASGFAHPVLGFDHLLAMVSVGLLSVQIGGRAVWWVPAAFVTIMAAGGMLGLMGVALPAVEGAIALSVVVLGAAIAADRAWPMPAAMAVVGFFALFHGHAHGAEIPSLASPGAYVAGFLIATALLHLAGVGVGAACRLARDPARLRALLGAGVAGIGVHILLLTYAIV